MFLNFVFVFVYIAWMYILFSQIKKMIELTCDGLASYPGRSKNIFSYFILQKPE